MIPSVSPKSMCAGYQNAHQPEPEGFAHSLGLSRRIYSTSTRLAQVTSCLRSQRSKGEGPSVATTECAKSLFCGTYRGTVAKKLLSNTLRRRNELQNKLFHSTQTGGAIQ